MRDGERVVGIGGVACQRVRPVLRLELGELDGTVLIGGRRGHRDLVREHIRRADDKPRRDRSALHEMGEADVAEVVPPVPVLVLVRHNQVQDVRLGETHVLHQLPGRIRQPRRRRASQLGGKVLQQSHVSWSVSED